MMRLLLLLALAAGAATAAHAQTAVRAKATGQPAAKAKNPGLAAEALGGAAPTPPTASTVARANALTANMQQNLGLSPQQTEKVRAINERGVGAVENARARYRADPGKLKGLIDGIGQSRLEALKDVLSAAQFDKYQRKREEKMGVPNVQGVQGNAAPGLGNE